jgi:short-subunit dehydrogenase
MSERTAVIIGASSGVGRALAEVLAERQTDLIVAATDRRDLEALAADLALRWGVKVHPLALDLADPSFDSAPVCKQCVSLLGRIDALLVPAGYVSPQDDRLPSLSLLEATVRINYTGPAALIAEFARLFERQGRGCIVGFSSIAAAVPRRRNMVYASAKAALEAYLQALRHYFAGSRVIVQVYALGYVDTAMTYGQRLLLPSVAPRAVCPAGGPGPAPGRGAGLFSPVLGAAHPPAALAPVVGLQAPAVLSLLPSTEPGKGPAPQGPAAACDSAAGTSSTASASVKEHGAPPSGSRPIRSIVS